MVQESDDRGHRVSTIELAGFENAREIGRGGMGIVYRACEQGSGRIVAIKVLPSAYASDPERTRRFRTEARVASKLLAACILPTEMLDVDGQPVLVMPFVDGADLGRILSSPREGQEGIRCDHPWLKLSAADFVQSILGLFDRVLHAVVLLHERGIIHRDIKPSNILVAQDGTPWLSDFGLVRLADGSGLTASGQAIGTPGYMSPEQWEGKKDLDARVDVFALGVSLYQALTLRLPFGAGRLLHTQPLPPPPSSGAEGLPTSFDRVILRALEPDPQERYPSVSALEADWQRARQGLPLQRRWRQARRRAVRRARRFIWPALGLVAAATLFVLLMYPYPKAPGEVHSESVTVEFWTEPTGASVVLVPLDERGNVRMNEAISARSQGARLIASHVTPGRYLVEAVAPGHGFHEVYRTVPRLGAESPGQYIHNAWHETPEGWIALKPIQIPRSAETTADMVFVPGGDFVMGSKNHPGSPAHERSVAPFFLDRTEVSIGLFKKTGRVPAELTGKSESHPIAFVSFDQVLDYLERIGKRLPAEEEYEFAATAGNTRDYPWTTQQFISDWPFGDVGDHAFDCTPDPQCIRGLYSNVAEWTASLPFPYPGAEVPLPADMITRMRQSRVVRGGPFSVISGHPNPADWQAGPQLRQAITVESRYAGLGFRGARSASPRLTRDKEASAAD